MDLKGLFGSQEGLAILVTLLALSMFSLLGLYGVLNATTELKISDNHEAFVHAEYAAKAGINHAREITRGITFDDLLKGPDGTNQTTSAYLNQARTYGFRNFISWDLARAIDISDPTSSVSSISDDGLINTGKYSSMNGTILIPATGIAMTTANPYGSGTIITGRYFVKVSDNNGEASELAGDPADNPFADGDGEVIIRSVGVAQTLREVSGSAVRRNSVAIYEARLKHRSTFDLDSPIVVQGDSIVPHSANMFSGNSFSIDGGPGQMGFSTIDTDTSNATTPLGSVTANLSESQYDNIQGMSVTPSINDITASVTSDPDQAKLLDAQFLYDFVTTQVPQFADTIYEGNQDWGGGSSPNIGTFDPTLPPTHPSQSPKVTLIRGDLQVSGNVSGGGMMVITGKFYGSGSFNFNGLVLVIGEGKVDISGLNKGLYGGLYSVRVTESGGTVSFGTPEMSIGGNSIIQHNSAAINMGIRLVPPSQISWRMITAEMDP